MMESGDGDDALLWANKRIKELESTVAALQEKIKVVEMKNSSLESLLTTFEKSSKIICPSPEVSGCKESGVEVKMAVQGRITEEKESQNIGWTPSSEPVTSDNCGAGAEMDASILDTADYMLRSKHLSEDSHTTQQGLGTVPQETCGASSDPASGMQLRLQNWCTAALTSEDGAIQNQVGQVSRKEKTASRTLQDQVKRHVALRIMYLGSSYHGFASQGASQNTVEAALFAALEHTKLLIGERAEVKYSRCGRTDKGVSAIGQLIALELRSKLKTPSGDLERLKNNDTGLDAEGVNKDRVAAARASRDFEESVSSNIGAEDEIDYVGVLNRVLPSDIRVLGWCPVPLDFNARFSCLYREYKYFFVNTNLDIDAMKMAGLKFLGDHDFRNFCKMDAANVHNFRRTVSIFEILPVNESWAGKQVWVMRIRGTAFLWHQIRCMAAVLFLVGQKHESPTIHCMTAFRFWIRPETTHVTQIVEELLNVGKVTRKPQYIMASELPLVLHTCGFQGLTLHCPSRAAKHLQMHLNDLLEGTIVQLALLQEAMSELPVPDAGGDSKLKKPPPPLLRRLSEPSYGERRGNRSVIPISASLTSAH